MSRRLRSLRSRLILSHLLAVVVGLVTSAIVSRLLAPSFFDVHLRSMGETMMGMTHDMAASLETGFRTSLDQALIIAGLVAAATAVVAALFAARKVIGPLDAVRAATRRLASGSYGEVVPEPEETELAALASDVNQLAIALNTIETRRIQLIGEVAHELRTPLATISGYMEGLIDGVFPADEETFVTMASEAKRLQRLADDLDALSRAEEGSMQLQREPTDLAEILGAVTSHLRPQFEDQKTKLIVAAGPSIVALADRDRIAQVVTNLIGNALTYTPEGGRVEVRWRRAEGQAVIEIADTGKGMTPDEMRHVFERFYRADPTLPGGTGIGLTIARGIARLHGGDISVSSPGPGLGSTFEVRMLLMER